MTPLVHGLERATLTWLGLTIFAVISAGCGVPNASLWVAPCGTAAVVFAFAVLLADRAAKKAANKKGRPE